MDNQEKKVPEKVSYGDSEFHVGGINDFLGGVDPHADQNLLRLTGNPG
ncbi:Hypothetical protein LUCI_2133 [Lucifera butyrica]|uniref:Uncharacterized protein n=1 Tax=Lucifera butyrica TaxID=1351585 RepID=A0A498R9T0_9FIRM|nr:hypothetical protein [Lucifera butyrica]VBB06893.1 Hypothetical protein LUCI_2133 [Lucifera butyrica]